MRLPWQLKTTLILPRGKQMEFMLAVGDEIELSNPGEFEPVVTVRRPGKGHVVVVVRADEERFTAADAELLRGERLPA